MVNGQTLSSAEEWRPVVGWEAWYEVSTVGRVRRVAPVNNRRPGHILSPKHRKKGYLAVSLCRNLGIQEERTSPIDRLVADAFLGPPPPNHDLQHIDGDLKNNHLANLQYVLSPDFIVGEKWLPVVGWEGWYEVSDHGRVRRVCNGKGTFIGKLVPGCLTKNGYRSVAFTKGSVDTERRYLVHALVAAAFIGVCPKGMNVNHKDGIKTNNKPDNLEYTTPGDNVRHAFRHGLVPVGSKTKQAKLNEAKVAQIRSLFGTQPVRQIADRFGIGVRHVYSIAQRETWKHVYP